MSHDDPGDYARPASAKNINGARGGVRHIQPGATAAGRRLLLRQALAQSEGAIDFDYLGIDGPKIEFSSEIEETTPGEVYPLAVMLLAIPVISDAISSDGRIGIMVADGSPWLIGDLGAVRLLDQIFLTDEYPSDVDPETKQLRRKDG